MKVHIKHVFKHLQRQEYFFPNSHGTSIHSDYWYGHGLSAVTIWIPILNSISGATFYADHKKVIQNNIHSSTFSLDDLKRISEEITKKDNEVLPPKNSAFFSIQQLYTDQLLIQPKKQEYLLILEFPKLKTKLQLKI